jgi:hypothetical protein
MGVKVRERKPGKCYEDVFQIVLSGVSAVHGTVDMRKGRGGHAWVEIRHGGKEYVYDPGLGRCFDKVEYYTVYNVTAEHMMGPRELAELALRHKHHGPYDEDEEPAKRKGA